MKTKWNSLIKRSRNILGISIDIKISDIIFECIKVCYSKNRFYHTLDHIKTILNFVQDFKLTPEERVKIEWAIWFHDYVYNATSTDNEIKSVEHFDIFAKCIGMEEKDIKEISKLIMITKHDKEPKTKLEKIIYDADLKELASLNYLKHTKNIRLEYSSFSNDEWKSGRKEFLEFMLNKKHIFHTHNYRFNEFENKARHNLQLELNNIKNE